MMYLYFGKASLVCLLVLLATFSLPARAKIPQHGDTSPKRPSDADPGVSKNFSRNGSKEPPTVTTTPQVTSTEGEGDNELSATTVAVSPSEGLNEGGSSNGEGAAEKKKFREEFLFFQVRERISRRNLTLGDIEEVLSQKDDDGSQFLFTLANKLGYIVNDKVDDPHIPVIKSHRDKLVTQLEAKKKSLMAPSQDKPPTVHVSDEPPQVTSEPASDKDIHRVGFEVSNAIHLLGPEAINRLLNDYPPDILGFAVGQKLGYSDHDVHVEYLENLKKDELIALLRRILESKLSEGTSSDGTPGESGGDKSEPVSQGVDQDGGNTNSKPEPKGTDRDGGNTKHQEASKPEQAGGPGNNATPLNGGPTDTRMPTKPNETKNPSEGGGGGVSAIKPSGGEAGANSGRDDDGGAGDSHPDDGESSAPSPSSPIQLTPPSRVDVGDSGSEDDNEGSQLPGELTENEQSYNHNVEGNGDGNLHVGLLSGTDEEQHMELVQSEEFQNYLAAKYNELYEQFLDDRADPDKLGAVLDEWKSGWGEMAVDEKGGGGSDGSYKEIKPETKQDAPAQPLDSDKVEGELDSFDDEEDEYDRPRSSSFGAWHFLSIFIVLGVMVVVGYICMHNRKKLREGVASYISDSSKRRKRAREYKPLIST